MRSATRRLAAVAAAVSAVAATLAIAPSTAGAALPEIPAPMVEGPIPAVEPGDPSRNYPFLATPIDLAARGYVEEEYFISGEACRYNGTTGAVVACGFPYETRMVVRRPMDAAAFNGTVVAEWQNVTAQYEVDHYWLESNEHLMREGFTWVGISAQRAGIQPLPPPANPLTSINTLKVWNPSRYGSLDVTVGGTVVDDSLSYDIFSQAVQSLRSPAGLDPLGPLDPDVVIAVGTSQSGSRLALYHNLVWPQYEPVVDAFFIGESRGAIRSDLAVPVLRLLSEVDVRADFKPADSPTYRHWEVAGASHADAGFIGPIVPLLDRDQVVRGPTNCRRNPLSEIPKRFTYHAAWEHMDDWVRTGALPPVAPRISFVDVDPDPAVTTLGIERDAYGNALGGIRLSEHEVATAENSATNGPADTNPGSFFCGLFGTHVPFDADQLAALYRNHGRYVSQVAQVNSANVKAGFLLPADSEESTANAAESAVGRR
jgi:hypothetical protein